MNTLMNKSISELHSLLVKGEVTASDLVEDCIARIEKDPCNCFEAKAYDQARKEAARTTEVKEDEYLKGIPFLCKDNYSTKGIETTASSNILNGYVPLYDATLVTRLKRAGMILVAKTSMDELAMGGTGTTSHKGVTTNPYDHQRIAGGSSSGSAAAVALGIAPFATGSDTGDSTRKPASNTGIVGYKPTWGRVSRYGLFPFATSMDTIGYFTRNVMDASYVLSAIAGHDKNDMSSSSRKKEKYEEYVLKRKTLKRVGYFKAVMEDLNDGPIKESWVSLLDSLRAQGYEVIEYDYPRELLNAIYPVYMIISCAEATSNNANLDGIRFGPRPEGTQKTYQEYMTEARTAGFSDLIKRRFVIGSFSLLSANQDEMFSRAQKARRLIVENMNDFFDSIDYLIQPAAYHIPPRIDELSSKWSAEPDFLDNILVIGNFGGYPSITLPMTYDSGMPIGINVTGRIFEDGYVFGMANEIEKLTGIHDVTVKEDR